ncbi:metallophosphoesterase family protein [Pseudomarimonas salicorniae]|uniref:Metallophosphoesterase family protein n=1 Tax=Pseudomarimonas salicorniae TaxID=2933270 RepID=A0ABT0GKC5_9GAMM|nr:metallophosphoesterase [Lysobacter sp. CAU 1642]MCK7595001.1 metallophosphoesterase family protein [Lysobacter sp. CAU 1642]
MKSLLHLSDTHFGTEVPAVVAALERMVLREAPEVVLLSGDITQRATRAQFRTARAFLDRLRLPWSVIPGNHDIPLLDLVTRMLRPYARYRQELGEASTHGLLDLPGLRLIRVKSTRRRRHIDGELSRRQIAEVSRALREAPSGVLRLVVTHQPVWVDRERDRHNRCHGADLALSRWRDAGADLLLAGHIHWPFVRRIAGDRPVWAVNAGTATSSRVRDGVPQSCNLLRWDPSRPRAGAELQRWDYLAGDDGFHPIETTRLQFD